MRNSAALFVCLVVWNLLAGLCFGAEPDKTFAMQCRGIRVVLTGDWKEIQRTRPVPPNVLEFKSAENVQRQIYATIAAEKSDLSIELHTAVTLLGLKSNSDLTIDRIASAVGISTEQMQKLILTPVGKQALEAKMPVNNVQVEVVSAQWLKGQKVRRFEIRSKAATPGGKVIYNRQSIVASIQPGEFVHLNFASPSQDLIADEGLTFVIETNDAVKR
jgi:hypothetical protein